MRKIENQMIRAINNGKDFKLNNTEVKHGTHCVEVYLHGHNIARIYYNTIAVNFCGYNTRTTKSRINALLCELCGPRFKVTSHKWSLRLNGWPTKDEYEAINCSDWYEIPRLMH